MATRVVPITLVRVSLVNTMGGRALARATLSSTPDAPWIAGFRARARADAVDLAGAAF